MLVPTAPASEPPLHQPSVESRFPQLRSVRWRINLGVLPSSPTSSVDDLRRVTADSRRRYAGLRRRLLVDPHSTENGNVVPDLVIDNPLSQNPDSTWGRFFRNAELEKMVDQDLSRLYPEHGNYFQTSACQAILRRVLLLWCLANPEFGYRQGMHELLAPLLYVLHVDLEHLCKVRECYGDHFSDKFDDMPFEESNPLDNYDFRMGNSSISKDNIASSDANNNFQGNNTKVGSLCALDSNIQKIVLLNDAYGAEGELGVLLSEKFMEHDAYCMFNALMSGCPGGIAMADYFSSSPTLLSATGLSPVIEASSELYHLLSFVDASLHSHLVELGVEPQYFSLRWLRLLFAREFLLEDLLIIWDEIFASSSCKSLLVHDNENQSNQQAQYSPQAAFIAAIAVSMLLHVRTSLLAVENATSCLQRLLNFPTTVDVRKLMEKAKSLQARALNTRTISPSPAPRSFDRIRSTVVRGAYSPISCSSSPTTPLNLLPESYWEEKWREFHEAEEHKQESPRRLSLSRIKWATSKGRLSQGRKESAPSLTKSVETKESQASVMRNLLDDFERLGCNKVSRAEDSILLPAGIGTEKVHQRGDAEQNGTEESLTGTTEEVCSSAAAASAESSDFSTPSSPSSSVNMEHEIDKSSVASNSSVNHCDDDTNEKEPQACSSISNNQPILDFKQGEVASGELGSSTDGTGKQGTCLKDRKPLAGKFQWLWRFNKISSGEASDKGGNAVAQRSMDAGCNQQNKSSASAADACSIPSAFKTLAESIDKDLAGSLKLLGQSVLENIQVIESAFRQDQGQVETLKKSGSMLVAEGQGPAAIAALKELRRIGKLLSESQA